MRNVRLLAVFVAGWLAAVLAGEVQALSVEECPPAAEYSPPAQALGGSCATYRSILDDGSLAFCDGVVDYEFYLLPGMTQEMMEVAAQNALVQGNAAAATMLSLLPQTCSLQVKRAACLSVFQKCELIDPFFADGSCETQNGVCVPCGNVTEFPPAFISEETLNPSYGSVCLNPVTSQVIGTATSCIAGPGKVPGLGNIGWELSRSLWASGNGVPEPSMQDFCAGKSLVWSEDFKSCMMAIPRSPCKSECHELWNMDGTAAAGCPLVSGNWMAILDQIIATTTDTVISQQASGAKARETDGRTSVPLLLALNLAPNCDNDTGLGSFVFSEEFTTEFQPDRSSSLGGLIALKAGTMHTMSQPCNCIHDIVFPDPMTYALAIAPGEYHCSTGSAGGYCLELATVTSTCFNGGARTLPDAGIRFAGVNDEGLLNPVCKNVITAPDNQPDGMTLQLMQSVFGLPSLDAAKGAFFVGPAPGLPALASGKMNVTDRPLCELPDARMNGGVYAGGSSYECAISSVKSVENVLPSFISPQCKAAFFDMICNQVHMKLEFKMLCLLPNDVPCDPTVNGASSNKMPFIFALPKFPSKALCTNFRSECHGFIETLGPVGTPQRDLFESSFNCDGVVDQTCQNNNPLNGWQSNYWNCASSFNGIPSFPSTKQALADIKQLLEPYATANSITNLESIGVTTVSKPSADSIGLDNQFICSCPEPLLVPENPDAPTLAKGVCCQQKCESHMWSESEWITMQRSQRAISVISLVCTLFVLATWLTFKKKHSQPLPLLISFCSFNISLSFLIVAYAKSDSRMVMCKDPTTPNSQADGGVCLFQSIWLTFWTTAACCFWLIQTVDLYLRIVKNKRNLKYTAKYYHVFAWGLSLIVTIIPLGFNAYGYERGLFWCFIGENIDRPGVKNGLDLGLFHTVLSLLWLIGTIAMFMVIRQIYEVTSQTADLKAANSDPSSTYRFYRTPGFFVFFFSVIWLSVISYRFDVAVKNSNITDGASDWIQCLLTNYAAGIANPAHDPAANTSVLVEKYGYPEGTGCGELYPVRMTFPSVLYLLFITYLQGTFVFIIFGAKMENINLWRERFGLTSETFDKSATSGRDNEKTPFTLFSSLASAISRKTDLASVANVEGPGDAQDKVIKSNQIVSAPE